MINFQQLAPHALRQFQLSFGDYLRSQRQLSSDTVPNRVGRVYQELIFNNVYGFLSQCFPISRQIVGEKNFKKIALYFFQRYPLHSPYFNEIPMQFVEFVSQLLDNDNKAWHKELTITADDIDFLPDYFAELAHYEWLELFVDTLSDNPQKIILKEQNNFYLNGSIQNIHYQYPVHTIALDNADDIEPMDTFLLLLRHDDEVKFVEINLLTHLFISFMQESNHIYTSKSLLIEDFAKDIGYEDIEGLLAFSDELFELFLKEFVLLNN